LDFTGLLDQIADAGGGDLEEIAQHVHGAGLPLVDHREQEPPGVAVMLSLSR
jgi:hypothetical protein